MGVQFLVDTGACHSFLPRTLCSLSKTADIHLVTANRSTTTTNGFETLILLIGSAKYTWKLLVADVTLSILCEVFLSHFHLLVDVAHRWVVNMDSYSSMLLQHAPFDLAFHISASMDAYPNFSHCTKKFSIQNLVKNSRFPGNNSISYQDARAPSVCHFRHLTQDCLAAAKQTFAEMEEIGFCQKASSPWSSPLHILLKKDGSLRPV
ncbi:uncharacterized protein [Palaemon carinicauda]|uniref:uncharacterized protein n=1 Tax=Palaemon carinicauda TaxID=392227 RepID=UPI0035B5B424